MQFLVTQGGRRVALQALFVSVVATLVVLAIVNTSRNMQAQSISVGTDFLRYSTGWGISFSLIEYTTSSTYARALLVGIVNTLFLGSITITLAILLGTMIGAARLANHKLVRTLGGVYVNLFRNIPLILQAFFWYTIATHLPSIRDPYSIGGAVLISNRGAVLPWINVHPGAVATAAFLFCAALIVPIYLKHRATPRLRRAAAAILAIVAVAVLVAFRIPDAPFLDLPERAGLRISGGLSVPPELGAAIVAISLFGAAYVAEIVRSGLLAVPKGLNEAGSALGLKSWHRFWRIRLPIAVRMIMPTMINQVVWLMKATSIGLAIGYRDFFAVVSTAINNSGQSITLIFILILGFWVINISIATALNAVNRAIAIPGRH